jgi:hypothetical protein
LINRRDARLNASSPRIDCHSACGIVPWFVGMIMLSLQLIPMAFIVFQQWEVRYLAGAEISA